MTVHGYLALERFIALCHKHNYTRILDIGAGHQKQAQEMRKAGLHVDTVDLIERHTFVGDYNDLQVELPYHAIWACHVLEHQINVNQFLRNIYHDVIFGGVVAITVPPMKQEIVGGHVSIWNAGLLLYNMVLAGFDCSEAIIKKYDYNISVIVRKKGFTFPILHNSGADLVALRPYFPSFSSWTDKSFNGDIDSYNWYK